MADPTLKKHESQQETKEEQKSESSFKVIVALPRIKNEKNCQILYLIYMILNNSEVFEIKVLVNLILKIKVKCASKGKENFFYSVQNINISEMRSSEKK